MKLRNVLLSFAAGLLGGALSHYIAPPPVQAESQALKEFRAERFVLVNEKGTILGTLCNEEGRPSLKLFDQRGREIWSAGGRAAVSSAVLGR